MHRIKFRQAAESEVDPIVREGFITQAEAWQLLAKASRFISEKQADTNEILAAMDENKTPPNF